MGELPCFQTRQSARPVQALSAHATSCCIQRSWVQTTTAVSVMYAHDTAQGDCMCVALSHPHDMCLQMLNPASMKQALVEGAVRLRTLNMHEQGNGRINLPASQAILADYTPRASLIPAAINLSDCPYMWPHCKQGIYAFGLPVMLNATVVNGMANVGKFDGEPVFEGTNAGGKLLHVTFQHSEVLWPWSGYLGIFIEVRQASMQGSKHCLCCAAAERVLASNMMLLIVRDEQHLSSHAD